MARKSKPESVYTVRIHRNGGYSYACTHNYVLDENGKRIYKICHWGRLTTEKEFIPGKLYYTVSDSVRKKLIFPQDWNLKRILTTEFKQNLKIQSISARII